MQQQAPLTACQDRLFEQYNAIRGFTEQLCAPLSTEDYVVQSMPDVSPTKWHIAHVSWFFETFVLKTDSSYQPFHPQYEVLFNSYYNAVGEQYPRARRGVLSRPTVAEVMAYRHHVDRAMRQRLESGVDKVTADIIELGLNHEQQHQELLLMDIKHVFSQNPLYPAYRRPTLSRADPVPGLGWKDYVEGQVEIGHHGPEFAFDNESPRHKTMLGAWQLADRLVTNGEYLAFINDGGYQRPELWLADGWQRRQAEDWQAPLYWVQQGNQWYEFTLYGLQALDVHRPVCHVSFYEADAYASSVQARLPTEVEWEVAAASRPCAGHLLGQNTTIHPQAPSAQDDDQLFGDCWEWTRSAYQPYPGFQPPPGAVGEYNGKFMVNQMVMRGGACVTPADHIRFSYRNFFYPHMRWQFGGIRLAR